MTQSYRKVAITPAAKSAAAPYPVLCTIIAARGFMKEIIMSNVTRIAPADSASALAHFETAFRFETDCWDVHEAMTGGEPDFVLIDARSPDLYARGHVPGAVSLPHRKIIASTLNRYPQDTIFVIYCAGPHCNGAHRGAVRLARLGRPVKLMIGGITGWLDEGFALEKGGTGD